MANFRHLFLIAALGLTLPLASIATAQIITTNVAFPKGHTSANLSGTITGNQTRDYVVRANAGQVMKVTLSGPPIVYFNVLPPGSNDEAIFTGTSEGNSFSGTLGVGGAYKVRVYQMRASARRGERGAFKLAISVTGGGGGATAGGSAGQGLHGIAGMNSIKAIDEMTGRGFKDVDSFMSGNTQYGIFYNSSTHVCAQLTMADSKVVDARDIKTHPKCH